MEPVVHESQLISVRMIEPSPVQTRTRWGNLEELAQNIATVGLLQPVVVRPRPDCSLNGAYQLVCGERRLRAVKMIPWETIPAVVRELTDAEAYEATALENLQREGLSPMEEARAINALRTTDHSVEQIADRIGRSSAWVSKRIRLLALTEQWQTAIEDPASDLYQLSPACMEIVARLNQDDQDKLYPTVLNWGPGVTTKELHSYVDGVFMRDLAKAGFDIEDATIDEEAGPCTKCLDRTTAQPNLFEDLNDTGLGRCLRTTCWQNKERTARDRLFVAAQVKYGDELKTLAQGCYNGTGENCPWSKAVSKVMINNEWEWDNCKRGDRGAVPVLVVFGKELGKIRWMKPTKTAQKKKDEKPADPRSVAVANRAEWVLKTIADRARTLIDDAGALLPDITTERLCAMAVVFGLDGEGYVPKQEDKWARVKELSVLSAAKMNERFYRQVLASMVENNWDWNQCVDGQCCLCEMIGCDYDKLCAEALIQVPDPDQKPVEEPQVKSKVRKAKAKK